MKHREWKSKCKCGKPKRYPRKGPCKDCIKEEDKTGGVCQGKPPADIGQKIDCAVLYKAALASDISQTLKLDARWLRDIERDPDDDLEWRKVVWRLAKLLGRCRVCGCKLRDKNRGERCWAHTYPGHGKEVGTTEDLMRGALHLSSKKGVVTDMDTARNLNF